MSTPDTAKPANDIAELRTHLFDTLRGLKDKENPLDVKRAHAICNVAQQITETARIELDLMKITKERVASDFLPQPDGEYPPAGIPGHTRLTGTGTATVQSIGHGATVTTHRAR